MFNSKGSLTVSVNSSTVPSCKLDFIGIFMYRAALEVVETLYAAPSGTLDLRFRCFFCLEVLFLRSPGFFTTPWGVPSGRSISGVCQESPSVVVPTLPYITNGVRSGRDTLHGILSIVSFPIFHTSQIQFFIKELIYPTSAFVSAPVSPGEKQLQPWCQRCPLRQTTPQPQGSCAMVSPEMPTTAISDHP